MPAPILATKLFIPQPPPQAVFRPRLIERLNESLRQSGGFARKLTLISAPAGFGKTTLVTEWLNQKDTLGETFHPSSFAVHPSGVAWLSLDEADSDPTRFLRYLVAAVQTVAPQIGQEVMDIIHPPQPPPIEPILTALLNEISILPDDFVLVLDDYHLIDARLVDVFAGGENSSFGFAKTVDDALTFLLEHLPPQMHLVITTREDPQLPLPRLRARGQLTELRAADLRFTPLEAAEFLNSVMGLDLSAKEITALEDRTEGWIAGLQLASLAIQGNLAVQGHVAMQGRQAVSGFVRAFAGDHRYIVDYLVAEVLQRQPEPVRRFLLQTSLLDRLNGPLCDAVTWQTESSVLLEALERGNFFLIPLDDKRHWYRYHHLFADVLRMYLTAEEPGQVAVLHRRASEWYAQNGSASDAIRHALAAEDFERAANLVELEWQAMRRSRQEAALHGWLKALPRELFRVRPVLAVAYAHVILAGGTFEGVEALLRDAEQWLDTTADAPTEIHPKQREMIVVDEESFRRLPGTIALACAGLALARGDVPGTVTYARRAHDLAPEDDHLTRGGAAGFLGLASWRSGDLETAHRTFADGMLSLERAGNIPDAINGATILAAIQIAQGHLRQAMRTYERGLQLAAEHGTPTLMGTADMYVGMSELEREHNDLSAATQHLLQSQEQGEHTGFAQNRYRRRVAMARMREAQGDLHGALDLLDEAERLYMSDFSPDVRSIAALKTRVWIAQGQLDKALGWAREQGLSAEDDLSYLREFKHITLARVLLARYKSDRNEGFLLEAIGLLERLRKAAEEGGRGGSTIEILVLQALAQDLKGDIPAALTPLERALTLAEPEGYVRIFLDEGPSIARLLAEAAVRGIMPDYTAKLLEAFRVEQQGNGGRESVPTSPASRPLVEPLSERELEILRLFKTELSGPEIAQELVIALSTVRTHTQHIYSKLNVTNRRAAVQRAVELNLI